MNIRVERHDQETLKKIGVFSWPIWEKEASRFDWHYSEPETCYFLEGEVTIETPDGGETDIRAGDYVEFPRGLTCTWNIHKAVRKHYNFG